MDRNRETQFDNWVETKKDAVKDELRYRLQIRVVRAAVAELRDETLRQVRVFDSLTFDPSHANSVRDRLDSLDLAINLLDDSVVASLDTEHAINCEIADALRKAKYRNH